MQSVTVMTIFERRVKVYLLSLLPKSIDQQRHRANATTNCSIRWRFLIVALGVDFGDRFHNGLLGDDGRVLFQNLSGSVHVEVKIDTDSLHHFSRLRAKCDDDL